MSSEIRTEESQPVTVARYGPVLEVGLNRAHRRNALTVDGVRTLLATLDEADASSDMRCVIIHGSGERAFCAGFDLDQKANQKDTGNDRLTADDRDLVEALADRVETCRLPVIAAVNGVAVGAGCDLALSADIRIGAPAAAFGMPPAKLGILYGWKGMQRLVTVAGANLAKEMLLTGELVDAERALRAGLLREIVAADALLDEARRLATTIAGNAPLSVAGSKRSVSLLLAGRGDQSLPMAELDEIQQRVWDSEDAREGLQARRDKRTASYTGR